MKCSKCNNENAVVAVCFNKLMRKKNDWKKYLCKDCIKKTQGCWQSNINDLIDELEQSIEHNKENIKLEYFTSLDVEHCKKVIENLKNVIEKLKGINV